MHVLPRVRRYQIERRLPELWRQFLAAADPAGINNPPSTQRVFNPAGCGAAIRG